ncbi:rhodanese-like domain-containing protein [Haloferax sp. Atlit-12N]|uniref:rhodanese-like domain-containing protein n=1 Tax=Haloferax sp. Atlit-12N TaxID=2077203 RepID=UPI000E24F6F2|nr:rhodanese-like domain-containing protein [Haloferax sp. Atlit-12N]RDZ62186.1 rhodanese-like domain-containing protein [Haloferax sp. Atlit-12N]
MTERQSSRRRFLQLTGAATIAGLAGCSSGSSEETTTPPTQTTTANATQTTTQTTTAAPENRMQGPREGDDLPTDSKPSDGYPPEFDTVPEERSIDTSSYDTLTREVHGATVEVPLVPIEDAYYWYARGEARFVDARSETGYDVSHIFGSVLSPAPDGRTLDPTDDWTEADRVVTYCHCPHHLSSLRAAMLLATGFENVYAIDEGFQAWLDRNYPLAGSDTNRDYTVRTIEGETSRLDAGETAWAFHPQTDQVEATEIESDGSYALELKFVQVDAQSTIQVETPSYAIQAPLGELTSGTVTADTGEPAEQTKTTTNSTNGTTNSTTGTNDTATNDSFSLNWRI